MLIWSMLGISGPLTLSAERDLNNATVCKSSIYSYGQHFNFYVDYFLFLRSLPIFNVKMLIWSTFASMVR